MEHVGGRGAHADARPRELRERIQMLILHYDGSHSKRHRLQLTHANCLLINK